MTPLPDDFADLAAQGVDVDRPGAAFARRAYPSLDNLPAEDVYSLGFRDGAIAVAGMLPGLLSGVLDLREVLARLYDPDVLPMPKVDGQG